MRDPSIESEEIKTIEVDLEDQNKKVHFKLMEDDNL